MAGKLKSIWNAIRWTESNFKHTPKTPEAAQGTYTPLFSVSYNGEKNLGEIGPIKNYQLDYEALRLRSWQSYLESEIAKTILNKFSLWIVGSGLKLQSEPVKAVLTSEKLNESTEDFNEIVEARFTVFAKSEHSDYSEMRNLNMIAQEAFLNSIIGGDVLVILRYIDNQVKLQLIDGSHVISPMFGDSYFSDAKKNGNEIRNGIELSSTGQHVAYYVKKGLFTVERISAKGAESGLIQAFLVYGGKYRLDNHRGLPLVSTVLETLKKLERYKEATVGSAEERQKIAYSIEHQAFSTGESPLSKSLAKAYDADANDSDLPVDQAGKQLADTVAVTTNKQAFNMPIGSSLKLLESKNELYFKDFYSTNIDLVCASLGIPPEVAMSKYDSNFSASRAALKDWEHTINVNRTKFAFQFYQKIYNFWLETEILKNKIQAPGYLNAKLKNNNMILDAYRNARFVGASVPHIDPLKEVNAERAKLGLSGATIPLTTVEAATEALNGGDSDANMAQYAEEYKQAKKLGVIPEPVVNTN